ncbi:MAG: hypothetical protein KQH79_11485 [Bacteroidetes bacterium]|nr:hypothetical protein [Bacteroidota bacterium]
MNYFKYIFSDKKANKYWAIFYILIVIPYVFGMVLTFIQGRQNELDLLSYFYFIFFTTAFFSFYSVGYFNVRRQEKFLKKYSDSIENMSNLDKEVIVLRESYKVKGFRTNFEGKIKPKPKRDNFRVCKVDNLIVLIGKTYDLGFLKRDFCPILIDINDYENPRKYSYAVNAKVSGVYWSDNDLEIVFKKPVYGLRKVILLNWKK